MAASITTLQQSLKTSIESVDVDAWALPVCVRVAEADVSELPKLGADVDVIIGYEASQRIGKSTNLVLEQALIPITVRVRHEFNSQEAIDEFRLTCEQLADHLADYHKLSETTVEGAITTISDAHRVEQLLTPHPLDVPLARSPGVLSHKMILDVDILRTITAPVPAVLTDNPFSNARQAVWDSINNWTGWGAITWSRKFESSSDIDELSLHDPAATELPAIAVDWGPTAADWWTHTAQNWSQSLMVSMWVGSGAIDQAETRLTALVECLHQAAPVGSSVAYIRTATGRPLSKNSPMTLEPVQLGRSQQLRTWKAQLAIVLTSQKDPRS